MRTSNTAFRPFAAILLISIPAALCVRALAQAPSPQAPPQSTPSTPSKVDTGSTTSNPPQIEKKQTGIPAPGNPLVLLNPLDRSGNAADRFDSNGNRKPEPFIPQADGGNYRKYRNWDPRAIGKQNPLPIFGMDFFAPARDYIDAERMRLRELAGSQIPITTTGSLRPDAYHSTGSQNQLPTSGSYRNPQGQPSPGASGAGGATGGSLGSLNSGSAAGALGGAALGAATASGIGTGVPDSLAGRGQLNAGRAQTGYSGSVLPEGAPYTGGAFGDLEMNRESQYRSNSGFDSAPLYTQRMPVQPGQYGGELPPYGPYAQFPTGFAYPGYPESYPPGAYPGAPYQTIPNAAQYNSQFQIVDPLMMRSANVSASVPASYRLSAGDMLTIRFWSPVMSSVETSRLIDETGTISLEGIGPVSVAGETLAHAQTTLLEAMRRHYRNAQVAVRLSSLRTISVTVAGDVYLPGGYSVPAVVSAYTLLDYAGGPTDQGSFRNIEVRRQGKVIHSLDLYKFILFGSQSDFSLQSGDSIFIPRAGARVSVSGEVLHPAVYELRNGESLSDALHYAGGVKASGVKQSVQVNTLNPGANRKIETVDATSAAQAKAVKLYDGDTVDVMSVRAIIANKVTIEGAVDQPSDYPLRKGMRVDDLLEMARGPLPEAYLKKAELYRWNDNNSTTLIPVDLEKALNGDKAANIPLTRWDRLRVYTRQEVAWLGEHKVEVKGAVQRPGTYFLADNTRLSDLLMEVGGPTNNANLERAVLLHCRGDGSYEYEYPRLVGIHPGSANDPLIQDNDKLLVYAVDQAHFEPGHFVTVLGDVTAEGIYPRGDGMTVSDLLKDAGGFRPGANTSVVVAHARSVLGGPSSTIKTAEIQFDSQYRCAPQDDIRLQDGDIVTVQGNGGFVDKPPVIYVNGAVNKPGPIILRSKTVRLSDAIRLAGGPRKEAFLEGAEFYRNPDEMVSPEQRGMARLIADLSNMENESAYKRELAKSDLERIRASATASQPAAAGGLGASPAAPVPVAASLADELSTHDLVSRPRQLTDNDLTPNGNIAVNLIDALRRPGSAADITLVDGDTITIPVTPTTVQVLGAVVHSRGVLYAPGKGVQYYVDQAGGFAVDVAKDRIVVIHAGGGLTPANKVRDLRPGDEIFVPTRVLAEKLSGPGNSPATFFQSILSGALLFRLLGL